MPKRASSKGNDRKIQRLGRDLHWYGNDDPRRGECHKDEIQALINAAGVTLRTSKTKLTAFDLALIKKELSGDIGVAETLFWTAIDVRNFASINKSLGLIYKSAARLKDLLKNEDVWKSIAPHIPHLFEAESENRAFSRGSLEVLLRATDKAMASVSNSARVLKDERLSEIVISQLMKVFEKHCVEPVATSRPNDERKQTPYLLFIKLVLEKTGLPEYDIETIIRATSKALKAKRAHAA